MFDVENELKKIDIGYRIGYNDDHIYIDDSVIRCVPTSNEKQTIYYQFADETRGIDYIEGDINDLHETVKFFKYKIKKSKFDNVLFEYNSGSYGVNRRDSGIDITFTRKETDEELKNRLDFIKKYKVNTNELELKKQEKKIKSKRKKLEQLKKELGEL